MTSDADNYSHSRKWKVGFFEGSNAFADYHVVLLLSTMPVSRHRAHRAQYSTIHTQSTIGQLAIARFDFDVLHITTQKQMLLLCPILSSFAPCPILKLNYIYTADLFLVFVGSSISNFRDVSLVELRPGADTWRRCLATCNSEDTIALVRTC